MTTRTEIIAQLDDEITRLERARDFLAAALASAPNDLKTASAIASARVKIKLPRKAASSRPAAAVPAAAESPSRVVVAAPPAQPKRSRKYSVFLLDAGWNGATWRSLASPVAALSGSVPTGPVAVSADEARKLQERAVQPPPPPVVAELRTEIGSERSLGSLIQAFERRAGLSGLETP